MNVDKYLRLDYKNRGRDSAGVDCWGLLRMIFKDDLGITLDRLDGYTDSENKHQVEKVVLSESLAHWSQVDTPQAYDAVVLNIAGKPSHVGLMLSDSTFIHVLRGRGVTVDRISNILWRDRLERYYRYSA